MKGSCGNVKGALYIFLRNFVFIPWAYRETTSFLKMIWLTLCSGSLTSEWQKNRKERFQSKETDRRAVTVGEKPKLGKTSTQDPAFISIILPAVCDETPWPESTWGERVCLVHTPSRQPLLGESRQRLKQGPQRTLPSLHDLLGLFSVHDTGVLLTVDWALLY